MPSDPEPARDLLQFLDRSPTPYHAVETATTRLRAGGFRELDERSEWKLAPGDRVFLVRGGGTVVALALGTAPPSRGGFLLVAAHTDSPNFRIKPKAEYAAHGMRLLGVEVYGSPLLHTWLDRDLAVAGRVSLLDGTTRLLRIDKPICRISNLAIHLNPTLATDGLRLNPQTQVVPALSLGQEPKFAGLLSATLGVEESAVGAYDLSLYDVQPAAFAGADGELVCSARLDNLVSCHAALTALLSAGSSTQMTRGIVFYDHEEVGSQSATGASSLFLRTVLERVAEASLDAGSEAGPRALARSLLVSADMAHAVHPNFADRHDGENAPSLGKGPVIKVNASQSYATDAPGAAAFERACRDAGVTTQRFVSRNDMRCGSTVGPISAARLAVRTVDVGGPLLSMHSCREVIAAADVPKTIAALSRLFEMQEAPPSID